MCRVEIYAPGGDPRIRRAAAAAAVRLECTAHASPRRADPPIRRPWRPLPRAARAGRLRGAAGLAHRVGARAAGARRGRARRDNGVRRRHPGHARARRAPPLARRHAGLPRELRGRRRPRRHGLGRVAHRARLDDARPRGVVAECRRELGDADAGRRAGAGPGMRGRGSRRAYRHCHGHRDGRHVAGVLRGPARGGAVRGAPRTAGPARRAVAGHRRGPSGGRRDRGPA